MLLGVVFVTLHTMRTAKDPLDTHQVCYIAGRNDVRGREEGNKENRPWLILSDRQAHDDRFFIGCSITTADGRYDRTFLLDDPFPRFVPPLAEGAVDLQQLWTFPFEQDRTNDPVRRLEPSEIGRVLTRLGLRFRPHVGACAPTDPVVGRVVWVELLAGECNVTRSDLAVLGRKLRKLDVKWRHEDTMLLCVIVASDQPERRARRNPYHLVTVVPLVDAQQFQNANEENPKVRVDLLEGPVDYSALTQLLLTVDYRRQQQRVFFKHDGLKSWLATEEEIHKILKDVRSFVGVAP